MIDQNRFLDLPLLQAPLLNILIGQTDANNREPLLARILETPDPRMTVIRIEELLELDREGLISELAAIGCMEIFRKGRREVPPSCLQLLNDLLN